MTKRLAPLAVVLCLIIAVTSSVEAKTWRWKRSKAKSVTIEATASGPVPATTGAKRDRKEAEEEREGKGAAFAAARTIPLSSANAPVPAGKPVERKLTKASSKVFDVRKLPKRAPKERERSELEGPTPAPALVEPPAVGSPDSSKLLEVPPMFNAAAPPPLAVYEGLDRFSWGAGSPPDTNGDVGPAYYIQTVNTSVGIYNKSDGTQAAAFTFDTLMSQGNFGNLCDTENFGDPVVLYDTFEDRWILSDFAFLTDISGNVVAPAYQCFAVSMNGNPVTGGWNFYSTQITDNLNDYPKLGVWPDGVYMSANMFSFGAGSSFSSARVWAFNKAQMYAGAPTVQVVSFDVPGGDFTLVPSNARLQTGTPPAGSPNYFVSTWQFLNALTVYKFHVDWNSISLSTFTGPDVPLNATSWPNAAVANAPQSGTATLLDVLQIRAMVQNQYTNLGGTESLWVPHTVRRANTTGFAAPRWYQLNVTGGTVAANTVQGTTWDPDAANVTHRFMPSLAVDRAGNMALGYSTSSSTTFPSMAYAGRLAADPVNTFSQTEQTFFTGTASQTGTSRWGDYSSMTLDPDGCTFWYTSEYANPADQTFNHRWLTKFGSFQLPGCTPVGAGGTLTGTVTATAGGAPISGATIQFGARSATTNASGLYSFTGLPAGSYPSVGASMPGYVSASASPVAITDGGTTTKDFSLGTAATSACPTDTAQLDFQTAASLLNVDLTTSAGDVTLSNTPVLDQQNTAGTTTGTSFATTSWGGQTFIPATTGSLVRADVQLFCSGCTGTTPNLTLSVRATSGGLPTGADLATATIPGFSSGAGTYYTVNFGTPATLTSGTQYALILRPVSAPSVGGYFWIRSSPSTYANGQRVISTDNGATWTADATRDFNFKTYIQVGYAAAGNIVSGMKDSNPSAGLTPVWSTLSWNATTPANTTIQFQAAGSNSASGPFNFVGPDGTAGTFFTTSPASLSQFYGLRYLRYKAYLATTNPAVTPTLNDVTICFADLDCSAPATVTPGAASVCPNSTGNTADGPAGATSYAWSITGGTITSATNTQSVTYTAGASGSVVLTLDIVEAAGCHKSGNTTVTINPTPATPTITPAGPTTFCAGGSVSLSSDSATGNQWYLEGNPIGGATNQAYIATASGTYTVVVTSLGCSSAPSAAATVTVNPIPATPTITPGGPTTFCAGGSVTLSSSNATGNQWYLNGNPISGETNQTYVATAAGDYKVAVTTSGCTSALSTATTVTLDPLPDATITAPGAVTTGTSGHAASVANAGVGATYNWGITGGTIDSGAGTSSISFTAGSAPGPVALTVTVTTAAGCSDTKSANVTVSALPTVTVTSVTPNSGSMLGGTPVTIAGSNFASGATVTFGGSAATNVVFVNSGQITAKTPAHAVGPVSVAVTNTDTSNGSLLNGYTYVTRQFDPNGDAKVDPSDIFYLVNYLYSSGPAPAGASGMASGDANGDGVVDPADIFYTVNYLFLSGPVPYVTAPQGAKPEAAAGRFEGSISLGQPRATNGRMVVPVLVTMKPGSMLPRAMSLDVRVDGGATITGAHRAAGVETAFEISRTRSKGIAYLVSFSESAQLRLDANGSATIAELELGSARPSRLEIDPALTMLVDGRGTRKATVKDGTLTVEGVDVGSGKAPKTKTKAQ